MTRKYGTARQRCASEFDKRPLSGTSLCPFKGPNIAIVPVRYALDRSRYDPAPEALKPLARAGKWARLPPLKSRSYTLRQLYDGYVYVYDETAGTLHEYLYTASDAHLARITWTQAHLGQDERSGAANSQPFLLYPRNHVLHIAYAPLQWTWRICEHMRSNAVGRSQWMKRLDLGSYCITLNEPDTLPLAQLASAVADIDPCKVNEDLRFSDSALPSSQPPFNRQDGSSPWVPLGADVHWLGSVEDKDSSLLIALDAPLSILEDLGMQLLADQAAYQSWLSQHEHKLRMASTVSQLCGVSDDTASLPESVRDDPALRQQYLLDVEAYFRERLIDQASLAGSASTSSFSLVSEIKSARMHRELIQRYGKVPDDQLQAWQARKKWRREVDLKAARQHIMQQQPEHDRLLRQVQNTQADIKQWAIQIGLEPLRLHCDTGNPKHLLLLQNSFEELLSILTQSQGANEWLADQEQNASTLFGTLRYGFSPALKEALQAEADKLLNGFNDLTNLATRLGELNTVLNHPDFADTAWMKALQQPARDTFNTLRELARGAGKQTAEAILMAWLPIDSQRAMGKRKDLPALLRSLLIGLVLGNAPQRLVIDARIGSEVRTWHANWNRLNANLRTLYSHWNSPQERGQRKHLSSLLQQERDRLRAHELKLPLIIDFQDNQYARLLRDKIHDFFHSGKDIAKHWNAEARRWVQQTGLHGSGIAWGVIMLNFINTALVWEEVSRDGQLNNKDLVKVGYSLGYTLNLLMAVYVEAPWEVVKNAKPVMINRKNVSILERSAAFWKAQGNTHWSHAIKEFRSRLLIMGALGIAAASLELWDLNDDYTNAKSDEERDAITKKANGIYMMGGGAIAHALSAVTIASRLRISAAFVMGGLFSAFMFIGGFIYLLGSIALNKTKQDSVGYWLRKCTWSITPKAQYPETPQGHADEQRAFYEIQLAPRVLVKSTHERTYMGMADSHLKLKNGAWVQIQFPSAVRGTLVLFEAMSSGRPLPLLPIKPGKHPIRETFQENGLFYNLEHWDKVDNHQPVFKYPILHFPLLPADDDVIWQTWVPLDAEADFLELQIWYPIDAYHPSPEDTGYLYQMEISPHSNSAIDGLLKPKTLMKDTSRSTALPLIIAP
ncbi:hypothetical protein NJC38_07865 [Pseudomonas sp. 21LCFQ010]|uniref:toxin VasX n=1 Tax=Pseudomonas sp. 21LCFQ010 TaxID=2957506 RepID=UPI002096AC17|nr:toxin VasX [Pseudomonas sp. 21LCFQ010]MCO8162073.1 hypothetical protein [Pseudomonas sp. 21LCFQ010]